MSENEKFRKRKITVKVVWSIIFLIFAIVTIVLISLVRKNSDDYNEYKYIIALYIFIIADIFIFVFWLCSFIGIKFHTYLYNGHEIGLYIGWSCAYLLLDGVIVDKHTGSFYGARPLECDLEEEKVNLKVGAFTFNSYTLKVGNKILH